MQVKVETLRRLTEVGLLAAGTGDLAASRTIFEGIAAVRPESELPLIGKAFAELSVGRHLAAVKQLQAAVDKNPQSDLAMSFLALALQACGLNQASRTAAQQVIDADGSTEAVALAKAILEPEGKGTDSDISRTVGASSATQ